MTIQLSATQESLYLDGGWSYDALLRDLNDQLDRQDIREPVKVIGTDGMVLFWMTDERRWA